MSFGGGVGLYGTMSFGGGVGLYDIMYFGVFGWW